VFLFVAPGLEPGDSPSVHHANGNMVAIVRCSRLDCPAFGWSGWSRIVPPLSCHALHAGEGDSCPGPIEPVPTYNPKTRLAHTRAREISRRDKPPTKEMSLTNALGATVLLLSCNRTPSLMGHHNDWPRYRTICDASPTQCRIHMTSNVYRPGLVPP
jgi:hypothetical protein